MPGANYRIKLYGHSSSDPDFFLVELAAVLEIDPESARSLLKAVPVVIRDGLSLEQAEHLQGLLRLIKALFIVEPTEESFASAQVIAPRRTNIDALKQELDEKDKKEALRSYAWLGASALISAIILVWLTGAFFSSYVRSTTENSAKQPELKEEVLEPEPSAPVQRPPLAEELSDLYKQMESADQRIQGLEFRLNLAEQEMQKLHSTYRVDPNVIRDKKLEVADSRQKLRAEKTAFKALKSQADAIEARLGKSSN